MADKPIKTHNLWSSGQRKLKLQWDTSSHPPDLGILQSLLILTAGDKTKTENSTHC